MLSAGQLDYHHRTEMNDNVYRIFRDSVQDVYTRQASTLIFSDKVKPPDHIISDIFIFNLIKFIQNYKNIKNKFYLFKKV